MNRAVVLDVPQAWVEARRVAGADRWDELWNGELHMVPAPASAHQALNGRLYRILAPLAEAQGLVAFFETGLYRPGADNDYRVPDQTYARPEFVSQRGIEGVAELVVEILSPGDESRAKLDWYAAVGVVEVLLVDPTSRGAELFATSGPTSSPATMEPISAPLFVASVQATLATEPGPLLRVDWSDGSVQI